MEYEMVIADPAGNITVFVLDRVDSPQERAALSKALLGDPLLKAEQAGFVSPPEREGGLWRLEMMGGEFCGNAARSFGLFVAGERGLRGKAAVTVSVSGTDRPVTVNVDVEALWAEAEIPPPLALDSLEYSDALLPVVVFDGITHVIAPDLRPSEASFKKIRESFEKKYAPLPSPALGVLFYDPASRFMTPAVYVRATDTLVFESSCGSGSAALGVWESREISSGERRLPVAQPGGVIEVTVRKNRGRVDAVSIGGAVTLGRLFYLFDIVPQEKFKG
jgi:diaminopimelate epimerase